MHFSETHTVLLTFSTKRLRSLFARVVSGERFTNRVAFRMNGSFLHDGTRIAAHFRRTLFTGIGRYIFSSKRIAAPWSFHQNGSRCASPCLDIAAKPDVHFLQNAEWFVSSFWETVDGL